MNICSSKDDTTISMPTLTNIIDFLLTNDSKVFLETMAQKDAADIDKHSQLLVSYLERYECVL
jgi:NADPH-dependent ferric siderophore reductase